jgi:hypothetical protein
LKVAARWVAVQFVVLGITACGGATQPPTPTPLPPTATPVIPTPTLVPTATRVPPSPTPIPPTATPVPPLALHIMAQLDPPTPHAGEEFVLSLAVANEGGRPARGVYIATSGPWDRWTVLDIQPSGTINRDAAGWHIVSGMQIPPGASQSLELHIRADEPAQEQLTFAVREAEPGELNP